MLTQIKLKYVAIHAQPVKAITKKDSGFNKNLTDGLR
jgi:hypothetical protein